jgi:hypothetical protein
LASNTRIVVAVLVQEGSGLAAVSSGSANATWAATMTSAAPPSHQRRAMSATAATTQAGR